MIKIVLTGPECTGKTTLSNEIAHKCNTIVVQEYARQYLHNLNRPYNYEDLKTISKGQLNLEKKIIKQNPNKPIIVCDTNLQVIKIWSMVKYGKCDPFIMNHEDKDAIYVLCYPDFKWIYDPLRENKNDRKKLYKIYKDDLIENNRNFITVKGSIYERTELLCQTIIKLKE
tara:strand:- start:1230 stop:1742 length:513 start_codon:yes stop_codon:yes gene_type:complete